MKLPFVLVALIKETPTSKEPFARVFGPYETRAKARYQGQKILRDGVKNGHYLNMDEAKARIEFKVADVWQNPFLTIPVSSLPEPEPHRDQDVIQMTYPSSGFTTTYYLGGSREESAKIASNYREEAYLLLAAAQAADLHISAT